MQTYHSTKQSEISNRVVIELNANVCTATFNSTKGEQLADLYSSVNSCNTLVSHNSCAPVHSTFVKTVKITFD